MKPRKYQRTAATSIKNEWSNARSTILIMATGGGKTFVANTALKEDGAKRVLWLVHRGYLIDQAIDSLKAAWPQMAAKATAVQAARNGVNGRFIGATVQTLRNPKRLKEVLRHGLFTHLVIDETHLGFFYPDHKRNDVVSKIKRYCPNIKILGLTATPVKANGENAAWLYDSVAGNIGIQELVEDGYLVKPVGHKFLLNGSIANLLPSKATGDYQDVQLGRIMDTTNNAKIVYKKWSQLAANRQTIGFTATIKQAENLALYFRRQGVKAFAISGKTNKRKKKRVIDAYKKGLIQVIFNCAVLIEGFDAPATSCILWLRPTLSQALFAQGIGRGLRIFLNKVDCKVLNFAPRHGQSLITVKAIYDPAKKKEFATERFRLKNDAQTEPSGKQKLEKPVLRSVEADIEDVTEEMMNLFIKFQIQTGRMPGQLSLKREDYNELPPVKVTVADTAVQKENIVNRILSWIG